MTYSQSRCGLQSRIRRYVGIPYAKGPEYADYSFTVQEARECTRRVQGRESAAGSRLGRAGILS
jgi:hypothetical protein